MFLTFKKILAGFQGSNLTNLIKPFIINGILSLQFAIQADLQSV